MYSAPLNSVTNHDNTHPMSPTLKHHMFELSNIVAMTVFGVPFQASAPSKLLVLPLKFLPCCDECHALRSVLQFTR